MFREMRRRRQALGAEEIAAVLRRGTYGVLALSGEEGYPYAVPISYVCGEQCLYFHSARAGHKIDAISREERASFCVVDQSQVVPEEDTNCFRSVIVFGRIQKVEDEGEARRAMECIAAKYNPAGTEEHRADVIDRNWKAVCLLRMTIEHAAGKEAMDLVKQRQAAKE